ncbi:hypothetical protein D6D29_09516 [Aureobasidium pullulans]|nr:hypothetical protein D6D29_09516 [Aureobasidium pullulans]
MSNLTGPSVQSAPTHSPLFTLPQELFEITLSYCAKEDVNQLRLVCQELGNVVAPAFKRNFASDRKFIFSELSMAALVGLTAHPTLAPLLKSIKFGTHRLEKKDLPSKSDVPLEDVEAAILIDHNARTETQAQFVRSGCHVAGIIEAMMNLQSQSNTDVTFGVYHDINSYLFYHDLDYVDCRKLEHAGYGAMVSYGDCVPTENDTFSTLDSLRNAVRVSKFPLKRLQLDLIAFDGQVIDQEEVFWDEAEAEVCIRMEGPGNKEATAGVIKVSPDKSHLTLIRQDMDHEWFDCEYTGLEDQYYDRFRFWLRETPFRSLDLIDVRGPYDVFTSLFETAELTDLRMSNVEFTALDASRHGIATAADFGRSLKKISTLEHLTLERLEDVWLQGGFVQESKVEWHGQEEIQNGLDKLIEGVAGCLHFERPAKCAETTNPYIIIGGARNLENVTQYYSSAHARRQWREESTLRQEQTFFVL